MEEYKKSGSTTDLKKALDKVLAMWLMQHIAVEDKKIGDHIRSQKNNTQYIPRGK